MKTRFAAVLAITLLLVGSVPSSAQTLMALVDTGELYSSADGGVNWSVTATLPVSDAAGMIAGSSPSELFLASESGVIYRSVNKGANWTAMGTVTASDVVDLAGRPDGGIIVLTRTGTAWLSIDDGATFNALGTLTASNHVSMVKGANEDLYALTATGEVAESSNNGVDWTVVGTIAVPDAVSIRRINTDLFVLTDTGLTYKSTDDGVNWTAVGTVSQVGMSGLVQYLGDLVAVNVSGLVARSTGGNTWTWIGAINQLHVIALTNDIPQAIGVPDTPGGPRLILAAPRPNPMVLGNQLQLAFNLPSEDTVIVSLFDIRGRLVGPQLRQSYAEGGDYTLSLYPGEVPAGVYYLQMKTNRGQIASRPVHLLN